MDHQIHHIRKSTLSVVTDVQERARLKEPLPIPSPVNLTEASTFKLTFLVIDTTTGDGVFPQQAHLLFEDANGKGDVTLPITIKGNGRASFTLVC